jgi:APA family basic amino acid/polyamine antiporter
MVAIKLAVLGFFIVVALTAFNGDHFSDFAPQGFGGIVDGAAIIFFAYIGFDAVSTGGEEAKRPQRDLPLGIIGALVIATIVYILVAIAAVGALPADQLEGSDAPLATAMSEGAGIGWAADIISFGALIAITSVVLTVLFGQTRVAFSMSRDGLLPRALARTSERTGTPVRITLLFAIPIAILAAIAPLSEIAKLVNIGTLFAFVLVNAGVIWLRRTRPDLERGYRVPFVPVFPLIGIGLCVWLMTKLDAATWGRFGLWLLLGAIIYAVYGYRHSRLRNGDGTPPPKLDDGRPVGAG